MQLRQLDICELNGLMVMCDLKGHISVFKLSEFNHVLSDSNWESSQTKSKSHCKERRLEIIPAACHIYAIGKQLVVAKNKSVEPPVFRMIAACGRKLLLIEYNNSSPASTSMSCLQSNVVCNSCATLNSSAIVNSLVQNPIVGVTQLTTGAGMLNTSASGQNLCLMDGDRNDITKLFQIKKEFICSDVPNLINLVNSFSGENYILVSYKNKCEMISERSGECLKQFQFNPMSNIRSIVELYDNHKLEILVTYNSK